MWRLAPIEVTHVVVFAREPLPGYPQDKFKRISSHPTEHKQPEKPWTPAVHSNKSASRQFFHGTARSKNR